MTHSFAHFRNGDYEGYQSSEVILAAIEIVAGDRLPTTGEIDCDEPTGNDAYRLWCDPSPAESRRVIETARGLIRLENRMADDMIYWGALTVPLVPAS